MRIPNSFVPKKDFSSNIEQLFKGPKEIENPFALQELLESYQEFTEKGKSLSLNETYDMGMELASNIDYNKSHLEELSQELIPEEHTIWIGLHFSALVNKIITEQDEINLIFKEKTSLIGTYLKKGALIIKGNTGHFTGRMIQGGKITINGNTNFYTGDYMKGGEIIVKGDTGNYTGRMMQGGKLIVKGNAGADTGDSMQNGKIIVEGNAGDKTGYKMRGGKIIVKGKIGSISEYFIKGTIIQGNKIVRRG